jgi:hypothetical protein
MLGLLLDYVDVTRDLTIKRATIETAKRLFQTDKDCATKTEAVTPEMVSPCLAEASVMSRVLEPAQYVTWLDAFLPPAPSADFKPLRSVSFDAVASGRGRAAGANAGTGRGANAQTPPAARGAGAPPGGAPAVAVPPVGATPAPAAAASGRGAGAGPPPRATWIGLAFTRAEAYARVAAALPATDARVAVFRRLAEIHAAGGLKELTHPVAFDSPGVNALAVSYLIAAGGSR